MMISFKSSTLFHDIHWPGKARQDYVKQMEWSSSPLPKDGYDNLWCRCPNKELIFQRVAVLGVRQKTNVTMRPPHWDRNHM